jgi:lysophospholipid acyltransferase (LPLAT)-like uncharacterized protein
VEGWENHRRIVDAGKRIIYTFWHGRIFTSTYFWRSRGIAVMTSLNRDGDYIARTINRFGYLAPRGSSSRGGSRALAEMMRALRSDRDVGFTIDGPLGPRYIAKPGAIWLASRSGGAVFPFHISAKYKWIFSSWDRFEIPKPFSPVLVLMGAPIFVGENAGTEELARTQHELQGSLEDLLKRGDSHWDDASASVH